MAKLSAAQRLLMFLVDSPHARVSYSLGNGISPAAIVSMERGHGTKSNPRTDTLFKLIDVGVFEGAEFADLKLPPKGRTILAEEVAKGWRLVTEPGHKARMEQGGSAFKVGDRVWLKNANGGAVMTGDTPRDRREIEFKIISTGAGRFVLDSYVKDGRRYCGGIGVTAEALMTAES